MTPRTSETFPPPPEKDEHDPQVCSIQPDVSLRVGLLCPRCKKAEIEYNGLLQLICPNCGLTEAGANT